jgi:DNA-binding SARP family transcriptional activator
LSFCILASFGSYSASIVGGAATEALSNGYGPRGVLDFRILGPLEVVAGDDAIRLGGPKQRATLAILLLNANRVVSVDRVVDDLYSGEPPVTAVTQVQRLISELRKALPAAEIETTSPGYRLQLDPDQLDLNRFERLATDGIRMLAEGDAERAADLLRRALGLWRGPPLADLGYESFARGSIERLAEMRLAALEERIEADFVLGRNAELVGELEALVLEHPLRERFRAQLMLALYRSGRQPEALDVYRQTREALVDAFGIEPSEALQRLERAILNQDSSLVPALPLADDTREPTLLVVPAGEAGLDALLAISKPLVKNSRRELIVARLLAEAAEVQPTVADLNARCRALDVPARAAAFTSADPIGDVLRLAVDYDAELVLLDASAGLTDQRLPADLAEVLERSPADVAVLAGTPDLGHGDGVFVPFGGGEHDWTALELGAALASAATLPLRLVGTKEDPHGGRRDASRLLANASLAVQRVIGVEAEPVLAEPVEESLVAAVNAATVIVVGNSPRWRREGVGAPRRALLRHAGPPVVLVHRGPRPSGLAPAEARTRFTWSLESS